MPFWLAFNSLLRVTTSLLLRNLLWAICKFATKVAADPPHWQVDSNTKPVSLFTCVRMRACVKACLITVAGAPHTYNLTCDTHTHTPMYSHTCSCTQTHTHEYTCLPKTLTLHTRPHFAQAQISCTPRHTRTHTCHMRAHIHMPYLSAILDFFEYENQKGSCMLGQCSKNAEVIVVENMQALLILASP